MLHWWQNQVAYSARAMSWCMFLLWFVGFAVSWVCVSMGVFHSTFIFGSMPLDAKPVANRLHSDYDKE